jgi:hypothetical protein
MPTPSLILVPARFKTGKLYTQIATTSAGVALGSSGDFSVTRATAVATRYNSAGLIETIASGIPRLDYYTSSGTPGCPALLVEPSGTNVIVQSQNWLASGWRDDATANVTTVTATTGTIDPLGTNTANAISPTSGSATHLKVGNDNSLSFTGTVYTSSAFFKQGTGNAGRYVQLTYPAARFTQEGYANFDLQLGTVAVVSGISADTNRAAIIENYGNGWYRCRLTATCNSAGTGNGFTAVLINASGDTRALPFAGTITDVLYGWGAQTETGSVATSYIPTTTGSVTRNADVINVSGAVSGCIGQTEGTLYAEVDMRALSVARSIFSVSLNSNTTDFANIQINSSNRILARIRSNTGTSQDITASSTITGTTKIAMAYDSSGSVLVVNGTIIGTNASGIPSWASGVNFVHLGNGPSAVSGSSQGAFFNDRIRAAALYTTRLTDAQLQALTTL